MFIIYFKMDQGMIYKNYKEFILNKQFENSLPKLLHFFCGVELGLYFMGCPTENTWAFFFLPWHFYQIFYNNRLNRHAMYFSWCLVNYPPRCFIQVLSISETFSASHYSMIKACLCSAFLLLFDLSTMKSIPLD